MDSTLKNNHFEENRISSENICDTKLDNALKRLAEREGFIKYTIDKRCVSTNGGNYLGILYKVDINGQSKTGESTRNIFVKKSNIALDESLKLISTKDIFIKEMFVYNELSKIYAELQAEANVPVEHRYKMVKVYEESSTEAIIMENLVAKGFIIIPRFEVPSPKIVQAYIQNLAKFHALSFVLKEKSPCFFDEKVRPLTYAFDYGEEWLKFEKSMRDITIKNVDEKYKLRVEKAYVGLMKRYEKFFSDDTIHVCVCHGDYRPNNILTKIYDGQVQEVIPVDYQLLHYGTPVSDFLYLIYSCTDRQFRKAHMSNLKDLYYETFSGFLKYFDLDAEETYSREEFERVYNDNIDYGLMFVLMLLPMVLASETNVPDISQELDKVEFTVDNIFEGRIQDVIDDYIELGYL